MGAISQECVRTRKGRQSKMEQEHSPLPFVIKQEQGFKYLINGSGYKMLKFGLVNNPNDLKFIVQACNAYEELLETCKWVQQEIRAMWDEADLPECNQRLEAVITKAEAKS